MPCAKLTVARRWVMSAGSSGVGGDLLRVEVEVRPVRGE